MRILRVFPSLSASFGGPVLSALAMDAELSKSHEVVYVSRVFEPKDLQLPDRVKVFAGRTKFGTNAILREQIELADVVVIHGPIAVDCLVAGVLCRRMDTPYLLYLHGMLDRYFFERSMVDRVKYWAWWVLSMRRLVASAGIVLLTSRHELDRLPDRLRRGQPRYRIVAYGTQVVVAAAKLANPLPLRIVSISRIDPKKNLELILTCLAESEDLRSTIRFDIYGPDSDCAGELRQLASQLIEDGVVTFPGPIYGEAKAAVLAGADFLVLPSHQENFAVSVSEALASGTPVMISPDVGLAEVVSASGAGQVVATTVDGWTVALESAARQSSDQYLSMSRLALEAANQSCSLESSLADFETVVREMAIS